MTVLPVFLAHPRHHRIRRHAACGALLVLLLAGSVPALPSEDLTRDSRPFTEWTLEEAVALLTRSAWARQETYTRVIGGIGSGISGEKEIYNTFFIRFLSARPIREAFARVKQIQSGYDSLGAEERRRLDASLEAGLNLDVRRWIVLAVSFRSNDPSMELRVKQYLEQQTSETMKRRAYLSTESHPQVEIAAYFPPRERVVGARFVFPRVVNGSPVVQAGDARVTFEIDVPGFSPDLRASFSVRDMLVDGEPVL